MSRNGRGIILHSGRWIRNNDSKHDISCRTWVVFNCFSLIVWVNGTLSLLQQNLKMYSPLLGSSGATSTPWSSFPAWGLSHTSVSARWLLLLCRSGVACFWCMPATTSTATWVIWCASSATASCCWCSSCTSQEGAILWGVWWGGSPLKCAPVFSLEPFMHCWAPHHPWCNYFLLSFVPMCLFVAGLWNAAGIT